MANSLFSSCVSISMLGRMVRLFVAVATIALLTVFLGFSASRAQELKVPDADAGVSQSDLHSYLLGNPISPPDTTSPRATLESFIIIMREASRIWRHVRDEFDQSDRPFLTDEERLEIKYVLALIDKAAMVFNLEEIPLTARDRTAIETVLQFQEILDRIYIPPMDDIPGASAGSFLHSSARADLPESWIIPSTNITIARMDQGPRKGHYLVTADTVEQIPDDYEVVKYFPAKVDSGEDLYDTYIYTPGQIVPPQWFDLVELGPEWLQNRYGGQAYWQWLGLILLCVTPIALALSWYRLTRWRAVSVSAKRRYFGRLLAPTYMILCALVVRYLCEYHINITGELMLAVSTISTAFLWGGLAWLSFRLMELIYTWAIRNPALPMESLDASLLHTGYRILSMVIAVVIAGYGATRIGIPVYGVIAGLGVGGIAIALAAQPTIENFIGGVILYADRMVRVGEFCEFDDLSGTIEAIGIRSTRLRALDRTVITIANSDLAKRKIVNFSRRDQFRLRHDLGLRYETSPDQMRDVLMKIRQYLEAHPLVQEGFRVRFKAFGEYALIVEMHGYVSASDLVEFLGVQEEILLRIAEIVRDSGSGFAMPSTTTYLTRDQGVDAEKREAAERHVANLRAGNALPFPDPSQQEDTGPFEDVWPPQGSVARRKTEESQA
nr:mechanosensitive ion channel family protein [Flavimaribacter sediminis]